MINSREKGARGERELAAYLRDHGVEARRGQQFSGSPDSPDVVTDLLGIHFECKRVERGSPYEWMRQANRDSRWDQIPVVAHRRNNEDWLAILSLSDFLEIIDGRYTNLRQLPKGNASGSSEGDGSGAEGVVATGRRRTPHRRVRKPVP